MKMTTIIITIIMLMLITLIACRWLVWLKIAHFKKNLDPHYHGLDIDLLSDYNLFDIAITSAFIYKVLMMIHFKLNECQVWSSPDNVGIRTTQLVMQGMHGFMGRSQSNH